MEKIILFDMDGTLIDSTSAIVECFNCVFSDNYMPQKSRAEISKYIGYTLFDMFVFLGAQKSDAMRLCEEYKKYYIKVCNEQTSLIEKSSEAILKARKFAHLGIVTTKTSLATKQILEHFNLLKHFDIVVGRDSVKNPKPHAEPILHAISAISSNLDSNILSKNIFMIGDTILDLIAAKNAGIIGVGVLCGYGKIEELKQYSNYIFDDVYDAVCAIEANLN